MKKIIAISVMLALVAGAVFAETAIGGAVETRFSLVDKTGGEKEDPVMGGSIGAAQIVLTGSNDDGTLGGRFRYKHTAWQSGADAANGQNYDQVYVWWKPIEQVKIFLGIDQDGLFDTTSIVGWGFHAGDNDYIFNHMWDHWRLVFPGNWDGFGLAFSFYPVQGLDLNLVIPTGKVSYRQAPTDSVTNTPPITNPSSDDHSGVLPGRLRLVGGYSLDAGRISFSYTGEGYVIEKGNYGGLGGFGENNGQIGASFLLTALDGMQILAGGSVILFKDDPLISVGLGFVYNGDGFGVKVRGSYMMRGDLKPRIIADVLPFFAVGEKGQVLVDIGLVSQDQGSGKSSLGWSVIPAYRLGIDGGAFKVGLQIYNNIGAGGNQTISGAEYVKFAVPMLLSFNF